MPGYAAAAQRLDEHAKKLVAKVILDGNVSLDTVQGFCALCPWLVSRVWMQASSQVSCTYDLIAYNASL